VVPGDASATAGTTAAFLMSFELYAVTVIISTYWLALILLLRSVVRRLLLVVNRLLELPRFRPNLGFLLLFVFLHLLLFRQDSLSGVVVQVNIHVLALLELVIAVWHEFAFLLDIPNFF